MRKYAGLQNRVTRDNPETTDSSPAGLSQVEFRSVQSLSRVQLFATPWTAARQVPLSITNSRSLLRRMSIEPVMPSNHLILCHTLLSLSQHQGLFQ